MVNKINNEQEEKASCSNAIKSKTGKESKDQKRKQSQNNLKSTVSLIGYKRTAIEFQGRQTAWGIHIISMVQSSACVQSN